MEAYVKRHKYSVVEAFVGHGIGRDMHEDPQVPNFVNSQLRRGNGDFRLVPGLVIAIEPMVNMGTKRVRTKADHWTQVTADGRPSAHFEHTVAITEKGPWILTAGPTEKPGTELRMRCKNGDGVSQRRVFRYLLVQRIGPKRKFLRRRALCDLGGDAYTEVLCPVLATSQCVTP